MKRFKYGTIPFFYLLFSLIIINIGSGGVIVNECSDETPHLIRVGESLTLPDGYSITALEISVDDNYARFSISKDGNEFHNEVVNGGELLYYNGPNEEVSFFVEEVFYGMDTNIVKILGIDIYSYSAPIGTSEIIVNECPDELHILRVGESISLPDGYSITAWDINVNDNIAWFSILKDGDEFDYESVSEGTQLYYDGPNEKVSFPVVEVFYGMDTNLVKIGNIYILRYPGAIATPIQTAIPTETVIQTAISTATVIQTAVPTTTVIQTAIPTATPTSIAEDSDGDGWNDEKEKLLGTNPYSKDSDNDGINDPQDSNPNVPDNKNTLDITTPGFEIFYSIVGLLAIAYLSRKRK